MFHMKQFVNRQTNREEPGLYHITSKIKTKDCKKMFHVKQFAEK